MINPYASDQLNPLYVEAEAERNHKLEELKNSPSLLVSSAAAGNAVMMGAGYFSPLTGFMDQKDVVAVAESMQTGSGLFWPVPIINLVKETELNDTIQVGAKIKLLDPNVTGNPAIAIQTIENIEILDSSFIDSFVEKVYGTLDREHPGVAAVYSAGNVLISGPIEVLSYSYFKADFADTFRTAMEIRDSIKENGWQKVVAFQTRNPMHRAHEELCHIAKESTGADGILIHMLLGKLKEGDIPADVRNNSIRKMVELYFPENTVLITGYGFDMLYAGPREAVLHAIFRQNAGCTHLIIGRDHAGVGDYYGAFDAQTIFDEIPEGTLQLEIFRGDHTVWCKKCNEVVMIRDCPHEKEDYLLLSGTNVRKMLARGEALPPEFSRPEVASILSEYYQSLES
ncbi:MAG: sulfate adenylyltransferase [Proteobacteria bacterium]|nr:sulfate adenylyltransferase [Pseudomonadota bacterium]